MKNKQYNFTLFNVDPVVIWIFDLVHHLTCILLVLCSAFLPPATAIVAKYWMTRLVFTVFPAPDSPLKRMVFCCDAAQQENDKYTLRTLNLRDQDRLVLSIYRKQNRKHVF